MIDTGNMACVWKLVAWELVAIDFERRAWIGTMMTTNPSPQAYLAQLLPGSLYSA